MKSKRGQALQWHPEADRAFNAIKVAIDQLPKLYFEDDSLPVYVQTDASYYGLGAYMFQLGPDDKERPIEFLSKTLTAAQRKWGVADKEAYAIFYAFKRWEHHLRDRKFVLQTDHENLTYVNFEGTAKVKRWKMLMQEFMFDIEYLEGPKNVVADSFSRNIAHEGDFDSDLKMIEINDEFLMFVEASESELCPIGVMDEQIPIPNDIRKELEAVHNAFVGHSGVRRTEKRLRAAKSKMKDLRRWVERYIHECPFCQKQSYRTTKKVTQPFTVAQTKVMQRLNIDTITLTRDRYGYRYVLTVIDAFSRWVMLYPLKTMETEEFLRAFIQHIGIFGSPMEVLTDQGNQLISDKMREVLTMLKTKHKISVAYSHEENAMVERSNKESIRYLRAMCYEANTSEKWSDILPFAQRICNAEVVSSIGVSPAQIIFGAAIDLDRSILTPNADDTSGSEHEHPKMSEYVQGLIDTQRAAIAFAKLNQEEKDAVHIATGRGRTITEFSIGSHVTVRYPENQDGKAKPPYKLLTQRQGPMIVLSYKGTEYQLRNLADNKIHSVHVSRLEVFKYDVATVDPKSVAAKDLEEFIVERVLDHRPHRQPTKHRGDLEFLIKWRNFGEEENSWVPWSNLTNNDICHDYCMTHQMKTLVRKEYRRVEPLDA